MPQPRSRLRLAAAAAGLVAALLLPATAGAASGYVVTVVAPEDTSCGQTVLDVTSEHGITPVATYTSALCGFAASLPNRTVRALSLDPRVTSIVADAPVRLGA